MSNLKLPHETPSQREGPITHTEGIMRNIGGRTLGTIEELGASKTGSHYLTVEAGRCLFSCEPLRNGHGYTIVNCRFEAFRETHNPNFSLDEPAP